MGGRWRQRWLSRGSSEVPVGLLRANLTGMSAPACAKRRIMLGLTQQQLAERIGITYQQAHKYEKGINRMAASRLYKVGQVLGVDVGYFFEELHRAEESPSGGTPQQRLLLELAKNFMILSPEHQQAVCAVVRILSDAPRPAVDEAVERL
jgi:transcriptional regulator with XRE-family HTH domain